MKKLLTFLLLGPLSFAAETSRLIEFHAQELQALETLLKPELSSLRVQGRTAVFTPSPSLQYFGVAPQVAEIPMGFVPRELLDLRFQDIHTQGAKLELNPIQESLTITIPLRDQNRAITSRLGSVGVRDLKLVAHLGFSDVPRSVMPEVRVIQLEGTLRGSGLLANKWILRQIRSSVEEVYRRRLQEILRSEALERSLEGGLLKWAHFSTGVEASHILPHTLRIQEGKIRYIVE
jgi:hypothetical protein